MQQDQLALPIVGRPPTGKSRKEIVRQSQARRRAKYGGVSISLQVDKELHRSLKKAAKKDNTTLSDYITELFLKHVKSKSSIVKNPTKESGKKRHWSEKNTDKLRLFEAFAGYGGASFALKKAKIEHDIVGFSENDKFAVALYEGNHKGVKNFGDITFIDPKELPDFDLFTGGFPCQPFSQVGMGLGEQDIRGTLFYDIIRICKVKRPKHILLENVKGLKTTRHAKTLKTILSNLSQLGYDVVCELINSKDHGIPQNRDRVWIYGYHGKLPENFQLEPPKEKLTILFKDLLDEKPDKKLYKSQMQIDRLKELYGLDFIVNEPSCADLYNKKIREDGISITILEPHHNKMRVVYPPVNGKLCVRNYSIAEHYRLMGFEDGQINFCNQSYQQLCKRAANGWDINLVSKLYKNIFEQIS